MSYQQHPKTIIHNGRKYKLNLAFDRVLLAIRLATNRDVFECHAYHSAAKTLVKGYVSESEAPELLDAIFSTLAEKKRRGGVKCVDFEQDEKHIYASFMQAYQIDLRIVKPHWLDFLALIEGLPDTTIIKRIMDIRTRKIPNPTKTNREEIKALMEAKAAYRLDLPKEERSKGFESGMERLAETLMAMARK